MSSSRISGQISRRAESRRRHSRSALVSWRRTTVAAQQTRAAQAVDHGGGVLFAERMEAEGAVPNSSVRVPPIAHATTGPNVGSSVAPSSISTPAPTISCTRAPVIRSPSLAFRSRHAAPTVRRPQIDDHSADIALVNDLWPDRFQHDRISDPVRRCDSRGFACRDIGGRGGNADGCQQRLAFGGGQPSAAPGEHLSHDHPRGGLVDVTEFRDDAGRGLKPLAADDGVGQSDSSRLGEREAGNRRHLGWRRPWPT